MSASSFDIQEAIEIIREITDPLKKERRVEILGHLPPGVMKTFAALREETGIPTGSLHGHLKVLIELGYIRKTEERPTRYSSNEYLEDLCKLAMCWRQKGRKSLQSSLQNINNNS